MALKIGLTGGIASGKSTISTLLTELGIVVIDADQIAREVVDVGGEAYFRIIEKFGNGILQHDGTIDRTKLGSIIFHNEQSRNTLNKIVHPAVRERMNEKTSEYIVRGEETVVLDIPLLFESNLSYMVDRTILVYVNTDVQLQRLMARNELSQKEAKARIDSQMPLTEKVALADAVLNNNGTIFETKEQLVQLLKNWHIIH